MTLDAKFKDSADAATFRQVFVNIRFFDNTTSGLPVFQKGIHAAMKSFYNYDVDGSPEDRYGEDKFIEHDQWVTLETPYAPTVEEDPVTDPAYTFHRCLQVLNLFLQSTLLVTGDVRIRTVSSHDFRPIMVVGARKLANKWSLLSYMQMHPEFSTPNGLIPESIPGLTQDLLNSGIEAISAEKPYITTIVWRSRAQRSMQQAGDATDAIINYQIAAESLLFDTYRMLLVDEGLSSSEITSEVNSDTPFKSLITRILPGKIGGQWDVTLPKTPVGAYWSNLYEMRNQIMHAGVPANMDQALEARRAYRGLVKHLEGRLLERRNRYPRTALVRFGLQRIQAEVKISRAFLEKLTQIEGETTPYFLPYDEAGRQP